MLFLIPVAALLMDLQYRGQTHVLFHLLCHCTQVVSRGCRASALEMPVLPTYVRWNWFGLTADAQLSSGSHSKVWQKGAAGAHSSPSASSQADKP